MTAVLSTIHSILEESPVHITLIDPDSQSADHAANMAESASEGGTSMILVGGTMGVDHAKLDLTLRSIRSVTDLPLVIFPASSDVISDRADALLFMSLMNSRNPRFVIGEAVKGAVRIRGMDIETISTGYVVVEPGMLVGKVGEVDLLRRDDFELAAGYATAAEIFGMDLFYLEGGSGVEITPPTDLIRYVKKDLGIPLVVGGGIRSPEIAYKVVLAGADIIVTGTMIEKEKEISASITDMTEQMRKAWLDRNGR